MLLSDIDWFGELQRYVEEVLGLAWTLIGFWDGSDRLPLHVKGGWIIHSTRMNDRKVLLVQDLEPELIPIKRLAIRLSYLNERSGLDVVYTRRELPYYQRIRMVMAGIPFVVAGSHLYLPEWGAEIRNLKKKSKQLMNPDGLSAASQYLLLLLLGRKQPNAAFTTKELVGHYSAMTVSRSVREWEAYGWLSPRTSWKRGIISWSASPREIWESAMPHLRSPVSEWHWVRGNDQLRFLGVSAGESALAELTLLAEPQHPTRAIPKRKWSGLRQKLKVLPYAEPDAIRLEIWIYEPTSDPNKPITDLLPLLLCFRDEPDARILDSIDQLRSMLPW